MRAERGHAERTIGTSLRSTGEFLDWLTASGKRLESVRIADVDAAIEAKTARRHYSRVTIRGYAERLRAFFRFAEDRGWCTPGMAEGIVPPRFYPDEKVRSTLSRDDVRCLHLQVLSQPEYLRTLGTKMGLVYGKQFTFRLYKSCRNQSTSARLA